MTERQFEMPPLKPYQYSIEDNFVITKNVCKFALTIPATLPTCTAHPAGSLFFRMDYTKPPLSIADQISLLKERGLTIFNESYVAHFLSNISFYRLSAYMKSFQRYGDPKHNFMPFASFERIIDLYSFDRDLRLIILDAIERIEVSFRCRFIEEYSLRYGNNWYEDSFHFQKKHADSLKKIYYATGKSNEVFIQHYRNTYTNPINPPSLMVFEILAFGQISIVYKNTALSDAKKTVADYFGVNSVVLESWIEHLAYLRNLCAHHSRIWNRDLLINKPMIPTTTASQWATIPATRPDKLYNTLLIIVYLLRKINPTSSFTGRLRALINRHPLINFEVMGFPKGWRKDPFWKLCYIPPSQQLRIKYFYLRALIHKTNFIIPKSKIQH